MTGVPMIVPKNVVWFQMLLYLSLTLDALSVAFQDRTPGAGGLAGAVRGLAGAGDRRQRRATRQRYRDRFMPADGGRTVFFLHRRRGGMVQRLVCILVSRTRCSASRRCEASSGSGAPQSRDPHCRIAMDPGSAAHRSRSRKARLTEAAPSTGIL